MNKRLFGRLVESMEQHGEIARGARAPSREFPVDAVAVKEIRAITHLSQPKFARILDIDIGTLRNWEQGRREPTGRAKALLCAIKNDPKVRGDTFGKQSDASAGVAATTGSGMRSTVGGIGQGMIMQGFLVRPVGCRNWRGGRYLESGLCCSPGLCLRQESAYPPSVKARPGCCRRECDEVARRSAAADYELDRSLAGCWPAEPGTAARNVRCRAFWGR